MREKEVGLEQVIPLIRERLAAGQSVQFTPRGTSMLPMLRDGQDQVVLSPAPEKLKKYDLPFYQRANGQYVLHRIVKVGDSYTCIGDNQYFTETGVTRDQILAVVTGFARKGKKWSTNAAGYRLYCRLWHWSRWPRRIWAGLRRRIGL